MPDAPRPVLPRPVAPAPPAVAAGPLGVGGAQLVARPRPSVGRRDLGEVGQAQVERVDPDGVGELVHRALQSPQARALDGRAHRRRHVEAHALDELPQPDRRRRVQPLAGLGRRLDVVVDQSGVVDGLVLDAQQARLVGREPDRLLHPRLVADGAELVGPPQVQLHRPPDDPGRRGGEDLVRPDVALAPEAAAGVRGDDPHVVGLDAERRADDGDHRRARLHRVPEREAVAVPRGDGAGGLHRVVVPRRLHVGLRDPHGGRGPRRVHVALVEHRRVVTEGGRAPAGPDRRRLPGARSRRRRRPGRPRPPRCSRPARARPPGPRGRSGRR